MSLRIVLVLAALFILASAVGYAHASSATSQTLWQPVPYTHVVEKLPWFDQSGVNFTYYVNGSYPLLTGYERYSGVASVRTMGLAPNNTLQLNVFTNVNQPVLPNGSLYDDPIFPAYLPVLPQQFVVPRSFSVLAPGYGLFFKYLGNTSVDFNGGSGLAYSYSVSASAVGGQGESPVSKLFEVSPSNGAILVYKVTNSYSNSSVTLTLKSLKEPNGASDVSWNLSLPAYAKPGNYVSYVTTGSLNETLNFRSLFAEPDGAFFFEKNNTVDGVPQGPVFFVDSYANPVFYPAATKFGSTISFGVAIGALETTPLTYRGETAVNTPAGKFSAYAYANTSIGFEAYLSTSTGVAVLLELPAPAGFIELSSSNFLLPAVSQTPPYLPFALLGLVVVVGSSLFVFNRKKNRRAKTRRKAPARR